jgi:hypothetical protein
LAKTYINTIDVNRVPLDLRQGRGRKSWREDPGRRVGH